MKHVVWKWFMSVEKEEQWLNQMAEKGLMLKAFRFGRYVFEYDAKVQYTYRIELLKHNLFSTKGKAYLEFLKEHEVEYVCHFTQWMYVRKKNSDEPFHLYSDIDSTIEHMKHIQITYLSIACVLFVIAIITFNSAVPVLASDAYSHTFSIVNIVLSSLLFILSLIFIVTTLSYSKMVKKLEKEKLIYS